MSQEMFNSNTAATSSNFQSFDPSLYQDMQFAASVPSTRTMPHFSTTPFSTQDVLMPIATTNFNYPLPPNSPYERSDTCTTTNTTKQIQSKAERRAEHNAIERARRESLNVKFQQLAFNLPTLQNDSRPSKSTIIDRTLDFVKDSIIKHERMKYRIQELEKFNRYLLAELDRKSSGAGAAAAAAAGAAAAAEKISNNNASAMMEQQSEPSSPTMNSPPPGSIMSDDSDDTKEQQHSPPPLSTRPHSSSSKKRSHRHRYPVSRSSVPMIPKSEFSPPPPITTNWSTTTTQLFEQQQQQQLKEHQMMSFSNNNTATATAVQQQSFFNQQQETRDFLVLNPNIYDQQQQHMIPPAMTNSYFNNSPHHHTLLQQQQHRHL